MVQNRNDVVDNMNLKVLFLKNLDRNVSIILGFSYRNLFIIKYPLILKWRILIDFHS